MKLGVLDATEATLPCAVKVLDAPAQRVTVDDGKHIAPRADGMRREKQPLDAIFATTLFAYEHGVDRETIRRVSLP